MSAGTLDWRARAACRTADPEAFFPEWEAQARPAQAVCVGCPVRTECLEYALEHDERFGIWGGLTEHERYHGPRLCRNKLHAMDAANTWTDGDGHEKCRACRAAGQRRYEAARRAS